MEGHPMATPLTTSATTLTDILFERSPDGLCLVAPDGTVVRVNTEWLRSTCSAEEEVVGEDVLDLFPQTSDTALAMLSCARDAHRVDVPRRAQVVDGNETWWEGSVDPVPMEGGTGLLIAAREVTDVARVGAPAEDVRHG